MRDEVFKLKIPRVGKLKFDTFEELREYINKELNDKYD